MRGKTNRYTARAIRLFGALLHFDVYVNSVHVLSVLPDKTVVWRGSKIRINPKLLDRALKLAR